MGKIYQVMVVGIKGEKKTIDVASSEEDFNKPGQAGDDPSSMRLLYTDKQLEDNDTFLDHQIKDRSTLFMVLRLPGGSQTR
ncbi:uncharacterized protein zgc:194655 isoform X2 [Danio aesculapii]|uniref:uncharacterized protein zgc:194655 isoform X2 n=1 Tax=Danio aesculapii TaxID=1142201 RepID=UPI0024BF4585|nr:uncharacterized protein zgc:194655 isoform X2 [Danio aesculapii]